MNQRMKVDAFIVAVAVVIGVVVAVREGVGAALPVWLVGVAYGSAAYWMHRVPKSVPLKTYTASDEGYQFAKRDAPDWMKQGLEPMPTPGDDAFAEEIAGARRDGIDIEALAKSEAHRREYPDCRYCAFLDAEKAAHE